MRMIRILVVMMVMRMPIVEAKLMMIVTLTTRMK